ncbi:MAG: hypothetical protein ACTSPI_17025 [Candidatus Heimdallarchaeaceae archaeon]
MKKGDIAYKVVEKYTRLGTNLMIYKRYGDVHERRELIKRYPLLFPRYQKGKILEADKQTEGFFIFEDKFYIETFICYEGLFEGDLKILRVKLLDSPKQPKKILKGCGARPMKLSKIFKNQIPQYDLSPAPSGSWVCQKIEVLD